MSRSDLLSSMKKKLENAKRDYRYQKADKARTEAVALQTEIGKCRGELEVAKTKQEQTIRVQSRSIAEGEKIGADTLVQEQILYDAAVAYMLLKDAVYSVSTIRTHESVLHAQEILDMITEQTTGKKKFKLPSADTVRGRKSNYGYPSLEELLQEKRDLLDQFFDELKVSGDIEACLKWAQQTNVESSSSKGKGTQKKTESNGDEDARLNRAMRAQQEESQKTYKISKEEQRDTRPPTLEKLAKPVEQEETIPEKQEAAPSPEEPAEHKNEEERLKRAEQREAEKALQTSSPVEEKNTEPLEQEEKAPEVQERVDAPKTEESSETNLD